MHLPVRLRQWEYSAMRTMQHMATYQMLLQLVPDIHCCTVCKPRWLYTGDALKKQERFRDELRLNLYSNLLNPEDYEPASRLPKHSLQSGLAKTEASMQPRANYWETMAQLNDVPPLPPPLCNEKLASGSDRTWEFANPNCKPQTTREVN